MRVRPVVWLAVGAGALLLLGVLMLVFSAGRKPARRSTASVADDEPTGAPAAVGPAAWTPVARPVPVAAASSPYVPAGDPVYDAHDLPMTPPLFPDPATRDTFRSYWIREMGRRVANYESLHANRVYPGDRATERLLGDLYDAAETPAPGIDEADMDRHVARLQRVLSDFHDMLGAPPMDVSSEGDDSRFGPPADPPVLPPGMIPPPPPTPPTSTVQTIVIDQRPTGHGPIDPGPQQGLR